MGFCVDLIKLNNEKEVNVATSGQMFDFYDDNGNIKYPNIYVGGNEVVNNKNINWTEYDKKIGVYPLKVVIEQKLLTEEGIKNIKEGLKEFNQTLEEAINDNWIIDFGY